MSNTSVLTDGRLETLARYRARTLRVFYLPAFEAVLDSMREALAELDAELGSG